MARLRACRLSRARAGFEVQVFEAAEELGGGTRTAELTLPGFRHDVCSAIHPLARASPVFRELGVEWIDPPAECAHPFDDGTVVLLERDLATTAVYAKVDYSALRELALPWLVA